MDIFPNIFLGYSMLDLTVWDLEGHLHSIVTISVEGASFFSVGEVGL